MIKKSDNPQDNKVKTFHKNIVVIDLEWFSGIILTYGSTFPTYLIKRENIFIK